MMKFVKKKYLIVIIIHISKNIYIKINLIILKNLNMKKIMQIRII